MTDERKDTDTDTETGRTRRDLLKDAGALAVGAAVGGAAASMGGFDRLRRLFGDDTAPVSLTPVARVTAQSPSDPNYGQYRGGPGNQGVKESSLSPVGVENVEKYFEGKRIERPPVTSTDGKVAAPGVGAMYVLDLETGEETTLPSSGQTGLPIFDQAGHIIYGDTQKTRKVDLETGNVVDTLPGFTGDIKKYDGEAYRFVGDGVNEFNISDMSEKDLDELTLSPSEGALAIFDDGNRMVTNQNQKLITYDIENETILNEITNASVGEFSVDDEFIYGTNSVELFVWDHDLNRIDAVDKPGTTQTPPIPFEDENGNKLVYNADGVWDGIVAAYEINSNSLSQKWQKNVEGTVGQTTLFGDALLISGSKGLIGLNRENGEVLFSESFSAGGRVGLPYQDIIPVSSNDGYRIVHAETDQIGDDQAELDHEWREMPDRLTLGETGNFEHYLQEVSGETGIEASVMYTLFAEDGGDEYEIEAPFDLGSGEQTTIPWMYEPVGETEDFEGEYTGTRVEVTHPLEVEDERVVTFEATPQDDGTAASGSELL